MRKTLYPVFLTVLVLVSFKALGADKSPEPQLSGQFIQGGMIIGKTAPDNSVSLNGDALNVSPEGYFVFGFDRDAGSGDTLQVKTPDKQLWEHRLSVDKRQYNIQYVEGIDKKIQSKEKPPETWERIRKENQAVKKARSRHFEQLFFKEGFVWPLIGPITGVFGSQRVYNGEPGRPHYGVDIGAPVGTKVYAPAGGTITLAHPDMYYSGGTIIIDHGYGISSSFLHLSEVLVKVGDEISQGDLIAKVGAGGRATGPHLDWRMNWYKRRIDPVYLVDPMPEQEQKQKQ